MTPSSMTPEEFKAWRKKLGWKREETAARLGLSLASVSFYENGERPDSLKNVYIPLVVSWACMALAKNLDNPFIIPNKGESR